MKIPFKILLVSFVSVATSCVQTAPAPTVPDSGTVVTTPQDWSDMGRPSDSHRLLETFVGNWDTRITFWSSATDAGQRSEGGSEVAWTLDNRFLRENFRGSVAGQNFDGIGFLGFDNGLRRFVSVWMDSMNTALTTAYGKYQPDEQVFLFESEIYDPTQGAKKTVRSKYSILSNSEYLFEMFDTDPTAGEFKSLEIRYLRKSAP